ncbi:hypothetical protein PVAP13_3KG561300 [Panicum virgatum]|uniref:Uncharacterized protein n=1 Tax=Panicum virgatum TaxID=38727 RepID=A0A8T0VCC2_PANVG|nr:hypothetical protein PVAP13_3KG561300 [Panicum virgatum]
MATRMWTPAASALRRRLAPGMPPPAYPRFVDTIQSQHGNATRKFSSWREEYTRAVLEDAKKQVEETRKFKRYLRNLKFMRWTLDLGLVTFRFYT